MYKIRLTLWLIVVSLVIYYSMLPPGQEKEELRSGSSVLGHRAFRANKDKDIS